MAPTGCGIGKYQGNKVEKTWNVEFCGMGRFFVEWPKNFVESKDYVKNLAIYSTTNW